MAGAQSNRGGTQPVHEVNVCQFQQAERAEVGRVTAAIFDYARFLFFDIDDHVVLFRPARRIARRLLANQDLTIRVRDVECPLGFGDLVRAQQIAGR